MQDGSAAHETDITLVYSLVHKVFLIKSQILRHLYDIINAFI